MPFLYIVETKKHHKIGFSSKPDVRVHTIDSMSPFKVSLIYSYRSPFACYLERIWQLKFIDNHVKREWFKLNNDDLKLIEEVTPKISNIEYMEQNYPNIYQQLIKSKFYYQGLCMPNPKEILPERDKSIWRKFS